MQFPKSADKAKNIQNKRNENNQQDLEEIVI